MSETASEPTVIEAAPVAVEADPIERAEARKAKSRRPAMNLRESDTPGNRVADRKQSKAELEAQRREAQDLEGKIECYYGAEDEEELVFHVNPDDFDIEFQLMCEQGTPARALLRLVGAEEMKQVMRKPVAELEKLLQSLAKQCGVGNF